MKFMGESDMRMTIYNKIVNFLVRLFFNVGKQTFHNPIFLVEIDSMRQSSKFISMHLQTASLFTTKKGGLWPYLIDHLAASPVKGYWFEFGVRNAVSANYFAPFAQKLAIDSTYHGFDSFMGIRNQWASVNEPAGSFTLNGIPPVEPPGCKWTVGWIEETFYPFLESHEGNVSFAHFDFDVYEPTLYALRLVKNRLRSGSIILFDEFHGYPGWLLHEKRALEEVLDKNEYEFIAFSRKQAAIRIL